MLKKYSYAFLIMAGAFSLSTMTASPAYAGCGSKADKTCSKEVCSKKMDKKACSKSTCSKSMDGKKKPCSKKMKQQHEKNSNYNQAG